MQEIIKLTTNENLNQPMSIKEAKNFVLDKNLAIKLDNLKIVFESKTQNEIVVLEPTNISLKKNKIYFIIGDSGVGKTTLITHFNGLLKSKFGNIFLLNDCKIFGKKHHIPKFKKIRKTIGMVFQFPEYQLFKDNIVKDVMFGPINLGVKKREAEKLAKKYLKQMGIEEYLYSHSPFELSGGQKRRVALAGILAIQPEILVFDEPTAGLDPLGVNSILNFIQSLKDQNKTIIIITHDMNQVLQMADKVIVLADKQVKYFDTPYNIFKNKELLESTTIIKPMVIQMIDLLISKNKVFMQLYDMQPKTIDELAQCIDKIIKECK